MKTCIKCGGSWTGREFGHDAVRHARFEAKYVVDPNSGCWLWDAACSSTYYGRFNIGLYGGKQRIVSAHRWSYAHFVGPIPAELVVMHCCDVPACVNPHHLAVGTQADNEHDKRAKGRDWKPPRGLAHPSGKFSDEVVEEVRARVARGETTRSVAAGIGSSSSYVSQLARRIRRADAGEAA